MASALNTGRTIDVTNEGEFALDREFLSKEVAEIAWLDQEIYVTYGGLKSVRVFADRQPFDELEGIEIQELGEPWSMISNSLNRSIYIGDITKDCIWRIKMPGKVVSRLDCEGGMLQQLSVTPTNELLALVNVPEAPAVFQIPGQDIKPPEVEETIDQGIHSPKEDGSIYHGIDSRALDENLEQKCHYHKNDRDDFNLNNHSPAFQENIDQEFHSLKDEENYCSDQDILEDKKRKDQDILSLEDEKNNKQNSLSSEDENNTEPGILSLEDEKNSDQDILSVEANKNSDQDIPFPEDEKKSDQDIPSLGVEKNSDQDIVSSEDEKIDQDVPSSEDDESDQNTERQPGFTLKFLASNNVWTKSIVLSKDIQNVGCVAQLLDGNFAIFYSNINPAISNNLSIGILSPDGQIILQTLDHGLFPPDQQPKWWPFNLSVNEFGHIYVADKRGHRVVLLHPKLTDYSVVTPCHPYNPTRFVYKQETRQLLVEGMDWREDEILNENYNPLLSVYRVKPDSLCKASYASPQYVDEPDKKYAKPCSLEIASTFKIDAVLILSA